MTEKLSALLNANTVMIGGHRGVSRQYPERTLHAVQAAIDRGVNLVETDIYLTKNGVPVLLHGLRLGRCSNGTGLVSDYTLRDLQALDFGACRGE